MLPGQLELPDCEPQPAELAKRRAAAPMRPTQPQKPCDHGLFWDGVDQIDLEEIIG